MEKFSALLAICAGNSPAPGEFPALRPVTRTFDVFFDLRLNKRLSKQSRGCCLETLSRPLWRHRNVLKNYPIHIIGWLRTRLCGEKLCVFNRKKTHTYRDLIGYALYDAICWRKNLIGTGLKVTTKATDCPQAHAGWNCPELSTI